MKVLLVNPPPFQIAEPYYDTPPYPRNGLAHLAGYIRGRTDHSIDVLDCKYDKVGYQDALVRIKSINPDVVGVGAFTNEVKPASKMCALVKNQDPNVITIIGGVHVTALPEETLREFPSFDYGVKGEGEMSFAELLSYLGLGGGGDLPRGVCRIDEEGNYKFGGERGLIFNQDDLPLPAWDLFRPAEEYILHTSRGCPFACLFCMNPNGRRVRARSPGNVMTELRQLFQIASPTTVLFGDEIFTLQRERVFTILTSMIEEGFPEKLRWWCQTHVSCIDDELALLMKKSSCFRVGLGVETGDEEKLKKMGKGTNIAKIEKAIRILKNARVGFDTFFIMGQPNETEESIKDTIKLAVKLNPDRPIFGVMVPYPGTRISEMAKRQEAGYRLLSHDWNDYNKQLGNAMELEGVSRRRIETLQLIGYLQVFVKNHRYRDLSRFVWTYRHEGVNLVAKILKSGIYSLLSYFSKTLSQGRI